MIPPSIFYPYKYLFCREKTDEKLEKEEFERELQDELEEEMEDYEASSEKLLAQYEEDLKKWKDYNKAVVIFFI